MYSLFIHNSLKYWRKQYLFLRIMYGLIKVTYRLPCSWINVNTVKNEMVWLVILSYICPKCVYTWGTRFVMCRHCVAKPFQSPQHPKCPLLEQWRWIQGPRRSARYPSTRQPWSLPNWSTYNINSYNPLLITSTAFKMFIPTTCKRYRPQKWCKPKYKRLAQSLEVKVKSLHYTFSNPSIAYVAYITLSVIRDLLWFSAKDGPYTRIAKYSD